MNQRISIPFYVRYDEGINYHSLSGIGESLIGLENVLPRLVEISGIESEKISVTFKEAKGGCIVFGVDIDIALAIHIFKHTKDFFDILQFLTPDIQNMGGAVIEIHRKINDFASENPVDYDLIKNFAEGGGLLIILNWFLVNLVKIIPLQKSRLTTDDNGRFIPPKIAKRAKKIINKNLFKKVFSGFVDGKIKRLDFSVDSKFSKQTTITPQNFGNYLSEDQKILSDWKNGDIKSIDGKFVGWQRKKGNSLSFRVTGLSKAYRDLICYPDDNMKITDFTDYLSEELLCLKVEVSRVSLYEKPKLIVHEISIKTLKLDIN